MIRKIGSIYSFTLILMIQELWFQKKLNGWEQPLTMLTKFLGFTHF
jgi:hypothetical protein